MRGIDENWLKNLYGMALVFEQSLEQINLRGLAGAIQPFNRDKAAGEIQLGEGL